MVAAATSLHLWLRLLLCRRFSRSLRRLRRGSQCNPVSRFLQQELISQKPFQCKLPSSFPLSFCFFPFSLHPNEFLSLHITMSSSMSWCSRLRARRRRPRQRRWVALPLSTRRGALQVAPRRARRASVTQRRSIVIDIGIPAWSITLLTCLLSLTPKKRSCSASASKTRPTATRNSS